jgi:hypothetical protein
VGPPQRFPALIAAPLFAAAAAFSFLAFPLSRFLDGMVEDDDFEE